MVRLHTLGSIGLHHDDGHDFGSVIAQPGKLALLTVLATSPHGHHDRERLLHLFWPDRIALRTHEVFRAHPGRDAGAMPSATTELLMSVLRREARPEHVHH